MKYASNESWISARQSSYSFNEKNDCAVKCISITTGMDYAKAHTELRKVGRKDRGGTYGYQQNEAMKNCGWKLMTTINNYYTETFFQSRHPSIKNCLINNYPGSSKNLKSATVAHAKTLSKAPGWKFLEKLSKCDDVAIFVYTKGHVSAYKNGEIVCWIEGSRARIRSIKIFVKEKK